MNKRNLTIFSSAFLALTFFVTACSKDLTDEQFVIDDAPLTAQQMIPASNATSSGTIDAVYDKRSRLLTYTVKWTNLMDTATTLHVHGLADAGAVALAPYPNGIIQTFTRTTSPALPANPATGSFTATLYMDGVMLKEEDLLAGKYYIDLHTKAKPAGELRGQLVFN